MSVRPATFATMGTKGRLAMVGFGLAALGVMAGCEPAPPAPVALATPTNLVSNGQYDSITGEMGLWDVEAALGKSLTRTALHTINLFGNLLQHPTYSYSSSVGLCAQTVNFTFSNIDTGAGLVEKTKSQTQCEGIIK